MFSCLYVAAAGHELPVAYDTLRQSNVEALS